MSSSILAKSTVLIASLTTAAIVTLATPAQSTAQTHKSTDYRYTLVDPGTFGGPLNFLNLPAVPLASNGALLGTADTTVSDSDYPNFNPFMVGFPDPYLAQAFEWKDGHLTNLGALPGNNSSAVFEVNNDGVGAGMSENGIIDPFTGWPAVNAVLFKNGQVINLGTLPGGYESMALDINNRGQVSGFASNGIPDPFSFFGWGTQSRSFIWQHGVMQDIGTLGGPDAVSTTLNARGQITGQSYTNATPNPTTGSPTLDPFLWENGHMRDLGTLGGTQGFANWLNDRGEVVGNSNLAGDQTHHPFLWDGKRLLDLGTLGGSNGEANWINDAGAVVGRADTPVTLAPPLPQQVYHATLWKNGVVTDLGTVSSEGCKTSIAFGINDRNQVVGSSGHCPGGAFNAFLWEKGSIMNLNTLIAPSTVHLTNAAYISQNGEIVAEGVLPNGDHRQYLLIPNED